MIFYYWKKNVNSIISNRREEFVMQIETYSGKASMTEWEKLQAWCGDREKLMGYIYLQVDFYDNKAYEKNS